jgi:hypothetical protein
MKIAVTYHALERYRARVEGAAGFSDESLRSIIRDLVIWGFELGAVRPHPTEKDRRIIPFKSGETVLYLSIGKNTTTFRADLAVIGVVFEKEVTQGKVGMGVTLQDVAPVLKNFIAANPGPPRFAVFIGSEEGSIEHYRVRTSEELKAIIFTRQPGAGELAIYQLLDE